MSVELIRKSASSKTLLWGTQEGRCISTLGTLDGSNPVKGGRFLVEHGQRPAFKSTFTGRNVPAAPFREYFDSLDEAATFFRFQVSHERFVEAKEAGLDSMTAEMVAAGKMTLAAALGDMDSESECHFIEASEYQNECEDGPDFSGGEDDNTPPLEVLMAGGWAAWGFQNEKNAWLDGNR